jgi:phosphate transport system protein
MEDNMERQFDDELNALKKNILKMAALVDEAIGRALKSLVNRIDELADAVEEDDEQIDLMEITIERLCLELLARRQPIAIDLRFITSVMKINSDLERIGDLAGNIAHKAKILNKFPQLKPLIDIPKMAERVREMLKGAISALVDGNSEQARKICDRDTEIDGLYVQIFREVLTFMMEDSSNIKTGIELILVAKHLERMADHITNIAEDIVYMVDAKTIKHQFEK